VRQQQAMLHAFSKLAFVRLPAMVTASAGKTLPVEPYGWIGQTIAGRLFDLRIEPIPLDGPLSRSGRSKELPPSG
jgi:hypothetical protein